LAQIEIIPDAPDEEIKSKWLYDFDWSSSAFNLTQATQELERVFSSSPIQLTDEVIKKICSILFTKVVVGNLNFPLYEIEVFLRENKGKYARFAQQ